MMKLIEGKGRKMSWDSIWEDIYKEQEWGKYPAESLIRFIARNFYSKDRKNVRILEVGCGPGANVWYMAKEGFDVFGIDGSETAVKRAIDRLEAEGLSADIKTGDVVSLPYEDNSFDAVVDVECLYANTWENTRNILSEIKRVLKNGGLFYSRTLAEDTYTGKTSSVGENMEFDEISDGPLSGKGPVRLMSKDLIHKLYGSCLEIVSTDKLFATYNSGEINTSEWVVISKKQEEK